MSPVIDLTGASAATLTFDHAANYFNDVKTDVTVWITDAAQENWTQLNVPTYPTGFTFVSSGDIDLNAYKGKKVKIGFKYVCTTKAGTYELKNLLVQERQAGATPEVPDTDESLTVAQAIARYNANKPQANVRVKGYIVGYVEGMSIDGATFGASGENVSNTNLMIADDVNETDHTKCLVIQLPSDNVRNALNLKENPENLRIYIQQQMERWFGLKEDMAQTRNETIRLKTMQEMLREGILTLRKQRDFVYGKIEQITERRDQVREQLHKIFPDGDVATYHQSVLETLGQAEEQKEESARKAVEARAEAERQKGYNQRMADTAQELEAQIARERSALDVWIRKYNATHSPVQFSELEQTFNSPTDWNAIREEIRQLTLRNMLAEARADEARLALAAHQVNALSQGQDTEDRTAALNTEIARLESEQEHLLVQLAGCQARLDAHELGLQKQAAEEARLSAS